MQKTLQYILGWLMLAVLLVGCQSDDDVQKESQTITFDATTVNAQTRSTGSGQTRSTGSGQTRAGQTGCMDNVVLRKTGFGVFSYSATAGFSTDWLSNTKLTYYNESAPTDLGDVHVHPSGWSYGTTKNWTSGLEVSFYAYAPYVAAGDANPGITAVDGTTDNDPTVAYKAATDVTQAVDLLWGVKGTTGLPWIDASLATTGRNVLFTFRHACAAIAYHAQVMVDKDNNLTDLTDESTVTGEIGTNCKVTIKSITLTCTSSPALHETGTLHLNNTTANTPRWTDLGGSLTTLTIDGAKIDAAIKDPEPADISAFMANSAIPGITQSANSQLVIAKDASDKEQSFWLIPESTAKDFTLEVEYYVTYQVKTGVYQRLDYTGANKKSINITGLTLNGDTKYYLNLVFGLKTLFLSVTATDWADTPVPVNVSTENGTSASESLTKQR